MSNKYVYFFGGSTADGDAGTDWCPSSWTGSVVVDLGQVRSLSDLGVTLVSQRLRLSDVCAARVGDDMVVAGRPTWAQNQELGRS